MGDWFIKVDWSEYPMDSYLWSDWVNWYFNIKG